VNLIRMRLTYANVMSTLFVFLLLAGGTAIAAKQLGKKTVGAKQLKSNAVTTPKIKKAAVTKAKIKDGAIDATKLADGSVTTTKIVDGAVTAAKIAAGSTVFSQRVASLRKSEVVPFAGPAPYPLGSLTQNAGEIHQYLGSVEFEFAASCIQPRSAAVYLLLDAPNPAAPFPSDFAGIAVAQDTGAGTVRKRSDISPFPGLGSGLYRTAPAAATTRKFDLFLVAGSCGGGGSGVSLTGVTLNAIGTK
jgi:hypothetical protein